MESRDSQMFDKDMNWSYPVPKTATVKDGKTVRVGDKVEYVSKYSDRRPSGLIVTIVSMHRQGRNGTILHFNEMCDKDYPSNRSDAAKYFIKR